MHELSSHVDVISYHHLKGTTTPQGYNNGMKVNVSATQSMISCQLWKQWLYSYSNVSGQLQIHACEMSGNTSFKYFVQELQYYCLLYSSQNYSTCTT